MTEKYTTVRRAFLIRLGHILKGIFVLIYPTFIATRDNLAELPFGYDLIHGNKEDGWNGNIVTRRFWDGQGWWPSYLGVVWDELSFMKKWRLGYQWCAIRNPAWNVRYLPSASTSVDTIDVLRYLLSGNCDRVDKESQDNLFYDFEFLNSDGVHYGYYRHTRIYSLPEVRIGSYILIKGGARYLHRRWGLKVYPQYFGGKVPLYKQRSVPIYQFEILILKG